MEEKQIIEVDYDKELVERYKNNYIMEKEGTGADPEAQIYDEQTNINVVPFEEMIDEGEVIIDDTYI